MQRLKCGLLFLFLVILTGCSKLNKATDLLTNPTAKERYQKDFGFSDELFRLWEDQVQIALQDSIEIELPFLERGHFKPRTFPVYSYDLNLKTGEKLDVIVETDSVSDIVFMELYSLQTDSLNTYKKIADSEYGMQNFSKEIEQPGTFKLIVQPGIETSTPFNIKIKTTPVYQFPVAGGKNTNIQSFWGAERDGGRRSHEGVDIFAPRGTPVVAVTNGRIASSGEKGLGGKQVWLRDPGRGLSLYYAHLDSIAPLGNSRVQTGDTIGFVGNTGNARTTAPHLHFGIYKRYRGAIDPLAFIFQLDETKFEQVEDVPDSFTLITKSKANLRNRPNTKNSTVIGSSSAQDTLKLLGKTAEWFHVRTPENKAAFIHESLVLPL